MNTLKEQEKSSDIEQQPPFGDRKISNINYTSTVLYKEDYLKNS